MTRLKQEECKVLTKADKVLAIVNDCRALCERIVLAPGCYDLLHLGHIKHLQEAKKFGEVLIAVVTADAYVNKGIGRPHFKLSQRMEQVAALQCVDYVIPSDLYGDEDSGTKYIRVIRPRFWVRGAEYVKDTSSQEYLACLEVDCEPVYTNKDVFSSSKFINDSILPDSAREWLDQFKQKFDYLNVVGWLDAAYGLKVLVIGEYIQDEYVWVKALGKSGKEPILVVEELEKESHEGGSTAVVNHVLSFCTKFYHSQGEFGCGPGDYQKVIQWPAKEQTVKLRYVSKYPMQKMFETYRTEPTSMLHNDMFSDYKNLAWYDLVLVVDYGHGLSELVNLECGSRNIPKFLAVNVQSNAGNHGYNTHDKYQGIDYLTSSENELRLAARKKNEDLKKLTEDAATKHGCKYITVTRGRDGVLVWGKDQGFCECPAFVDHYVDRIGAGDAVLAVTSLLAVQGAPADIIALVANATGSLAVQIVGNREPITKTKLLQYLRTLLK